MIEDLQCFLLQDAGDISNPDRTLHPGKGQNQKGQNTNTDRSKGTNHGEEVEEMKN